MNPRALVVGVFENPSVDGRMGTGGTVAVATAILDGRFALSLNEPL